MGKNNDTMNASLERMKSLMTYGMQNESKQYSSIENSHVAADGKTYAIIREGAKFFIKETTKKNPLKEDFDYVGGFRNRKHYEYKSFADAQKNFDFKMRSIREARANDNIVIESWNPDKQVMLAEENVKQVRSEINRQREIMTRLGMISEKKNFEGNAEGKAKDVTGKDAAAQKKNIKSEKPKMGDAKKADDFWTPVDASTTQKINNGCCPKCGNKPCTCKSLKESDNVLGWNDDEDYLDMSNGTEIGDGAPFEKPIGDKSDVVEESEVMHTSQNQNSPTPGTNKIGDDAPFTEEVDMDGVDSLEEDDDLELGDDAGMEAEEPELDAEDEDDYDEFEGEDGADEGVDEVYGEEIVDRINRLEGLLDKIASKLGVEDGVDVEEYEDEDLYDDAPEDEEPEYELEMDGDEADDEMDDDDDEEEVVYESRAYRRLMKEDQLDVYGKHPAYQKKVMNLPSSHHNEKPGYYDMNDSSVESEAPYGQSVGDSAPFDVDPDEIANSIAESIQRMLKKK